jgi:hypothetical protein
MASGVARYGGVHRAPYYDDKLDKARGRGLLGGVRRLLGLVPAPPVLPPPATASGPSYTTYGGPSYLRAGGARGFGGGGRGPLLPGGGRSGGVARGGARQLKTCGRVLAVALLLALLWWRFGGSSVIVGGAPRLQSGGEAAVVDAAAAAVKDAGEVQQPLQQGERQLAGEKVEVAREPAEPPAL